MINKITDILNKYLEDYAIIPDKDGTSSIVFFLPYKTYEECGKDSIFIDAYFQASNKLYYIIKKIIAEFSEAGINSVTEKRYILKYLAEKGGLGRKTATTLIANNKYGTRIVLGSIKIDGKYQLIRENKTEELCSKCNKCFSACPTGALSEKGFNIDLCIRELQSKGAECEDNSAALMGNKVWGCDECQKKCPLNKNIESTAVNSELKEMLNVNNFINLAISGSKALTPLIPYIGYNYLRPKKLLALGFNAAANMNNDKCIEQALELKDSPDVKISLNARRVISKYNNRHNK